ncbi:hypothetical protein [Clostridium thermosuccinogenes]|uniref:hypothetical protein n=1 Tax=Clostridium thermosuccinogenes TaxID=84032 RepID=UPI001374C6A5|nr:hypothetical protein [Pseudoclostridium thermosuccinogenes]
MKSWKYIKTGDAPSLVAEMKSWKYTKTEDAPSLITILWKRGTFLYFAILNSGNTISTA